MPRPENQTRFFPAALNASSAFAVASTDVALESLEFDAGDLSDKFDPARRLLNSRTVARIDSGDAPHASQRPWLPHILNIVQAPQKFSSRVVNFISWPPVRQTTHYRAGRIPDPTLA